MAAFPGCTRCCLGQQLGGVPPGQVSWDVRLGPLSATTFRWAVATCQAAGPEGGSLAAYPLCPALQAHNGVSSGIQVEASPSPASPQIKTGITITHRPGYSWSHRTRKWDPNAPRRCSCRHCSPCSSRGFHRLVSEDPDQCMMWCCQAAAQAFGHRPHLKGCLRRG